MPVSVKCEDADHVRELLEQRVKYEREIADERNKRYQERWQAQETAAQNLKEYQNEFRGSLSDLGSHMATKVELATANRTVTEKVDALTTQMSELRSRLDVGNPTVAALQNQFSNSAGMRIGSDKMFSYVIGASGAIVGVVGLILAFTK